MFVKSIADERRTSGKVTFVITSDMGDGEECFTLSSGELARLESGLGYAVNKLDAVTEELYDALKSADERTRALLEAARILSFSEKSRRSLRQKLRLKGFSSEAADHAVNILTKKGYLNDEKACREIAGSLVRKKRFGKTRVVAYLASHGYDVSEAKNAAEEIESAEYLEALRYNIEKKFPDIEEMPREKRQKAVQSLLRLGFSSDEIIKEIKNRADKR